MGDGKTELYHQVGEYIVDFLVKQGYLKITDSTNNNRYWIVVTQ
ncbi:hypothetical protein AAC03nite_38870 [Alicyclobacillus acidoterrestris]|nr:hypothetical protein AAC03nite_38870 [Alicyclobacillus acidoterrestris]